MARAVRLSLASRDEHEAAEVPADAAEQQERHDGRRRRPAGDVAPELRLDRRERDVEHEHAVELGGGIVAAVALGPVLDGQDAAKHVGAVFR